MKNKILFIKKFFNNGFLKNKFISFSIKSLITLGVLYYIFLNINPKEIFYQVANTNKLMFSIAIALVIINIALQFYKWKFTVKVVLNVDDNKKILNSLLQGLAAAVSTPARLGEYVGRALPFSDKSFLQVTLASLIDKFFSILIITILGALSTILFIHYYYDVYLLLTISFLILIVLLFYLTFLLLFNENFWDNFLFNRIKNSNKLNRYYKKFEVLKGLDKHYKTKMLLLSLLFYLCVVVQYAFLVMAFSYKTDFINYIWVGNLIMFTKSLIQPFTLGELGIRESASIYFIQKFGESSTVGFNASIFLFLINIILPAIVGIILQIKNKND